MPAPKPKKLAGGRYQARFQIGGRDFDRTFSSYAAAAAFISEHWRPKARWSRPAAGNLSRDIKDFLKDQAIRGLSSSWLTGLSQMLERNFLGYCESVKVTDTAAVDAGLLRGYMKWWFAHAPFGTRPAPNKMADYAATWSMYRQAISVFCNWAVRRGYLDRNPANADEFKPKVKRRIPDTFEPFEVRKIIEFLDGEHPYKGIFIRILIYTGMRLSEAANLRWTDVDLRSRLIKIRYSSKSDRDRTIPIADELRPYIEALPRNTVLVLDDGKGRPFQNKKTYWSDIQRACVLNGIRRRRLHDLRHSCARYLIESNTDIVTVQNILGHEDIRTTQRYLRHFNLKLAQDAVNRVKLKLAKPPED